ncbi:MAG TPA: hypothetical protein VFA45_10480 [Actinomycetes bacterium]|nr:hypothetical protein [Actinomycetes bacterium]
MTKVLRVAVGPDDASRPAGAFFDPLGRNAATAAAQATAAVAQLRTIGADLKAVKQGVAALPDDEANILAAIAAVDAGMSDEQAEAAAAKIAENLNQTLPAGVIAALKEAL